MMTLIHDIIRMVYAEEHFWNVLDLSIGAGPFDGGCYIVAVALRQTFGGKIVTLVDNQGRADHYGCFIDGYVYDFDGVAESGEKWCERFLTEEGYPLDSMSYVPKYVPEKSIPRDIIASKTISQMLLNARDILDR